MKRLLIGSLVTAFLMVSAPAMADDDNRRGSGWQKHHERGQAMPPGHQKKFLQAHYRRDHYDRHHHKRKHQQWDRKHHSRNDRHHYSGKKHKRDVYRDRYDRYDRHHSGQYRIRLGYSDGLPPEARIGRIIHDTHVLVESSRR